MQLLARLETLHPGDLRVRHNLAVARFHKTAGVFGHEYAAVIAAVLQAAPSPKQTSTAAAPATASSFAAPTYNAALLDYRIGNVSLASARLEPLVAARDALSPALASRILCLYVDTLLREGRTAAASEASALVEKLQQATAASAATTETDPDVEDEKLRFYSGESIIVAAARSLVSHEGSPVDSPTQMPHCLAGGQCARVQAGSQG
jgi:hypothetical protein